MIGDAAYGRIRSAGSGRGREAVGAAELAFRKYRLSRGESPKPGQRAPEDTYREELATLRTALANAPSASP